MKVGHFLNLWVNFSNFEFLYFLQTYITIFYTTKYASKSISLTIVHRFDLFGNLSFNYITFAIYCFTFYVIDHLLPLVFINRH